MSASSFSYDKAIALLLEYESLLSRASGMLRQIEAAEVTSPRMTKAGTGRVSQKGDIRNPSRIEWRSWLRRNH